MTLKSETWFTLFVAAALFYVAVNIQSGWLFVLDFAIWAVLISSGLFGYLWIRGEIRVERFAPEVFEGENLDVSVRLTNLSNRGKYFLVLEDPVPGRDSRNPAFLFFPAVEKGKTEERRYRLPARRRGLYIRDFTVLSSAGPLGFFRWKRKAPCRCVTTVYPRPQLFDFSFGGYDASGFPGEKGTPRGKGGDDEFCGIREYEPGDSARVIHWISTAKTGKLMAREMSRTVPPAAGFYVDCDRRWAGETFEAMVRLAAYAVERTLENGGRAGIFQKGNEAPAKDWRGNLEILACLQAENPQTLPEQIESQIHLFPAAGRRLFFFTALPPVFNSSEWRVLNALGGAGQIHFVFLDPNGNFPVRNSVSRWFSGQGIKVSFAGIRSEENAFSNAS